MPLGYSDVEILPSRGQQSLSFKLDARHFLFSILLRLGTAALESCFFFRVVFLAIKLNLGQI